MRQRIAGWGPARPHGEYRPRTTSSASESAWGKNAPQLKEEKHEPPLVKVWLLAAIAALLLAALAAARCSQVGSAPPTPAEAVQQAWQRARDLGAYRFTTDLAATAYPAPPGQRWPDGREERLHLEGQR